MSSPVNEVSNIGNEDEKINEIKEENKKMNNEDT